MHSLLKVVDCYLASKFFRMRIVSFIVWLLLSVGLAWALNNPLGSLPAIGKLLSPNQGFWQQMEGDLPSLPESVASNFLQNEVTVSWDENLVPHVFAQNDADLYFVQGYITASLRLWQMDFQTRAAAGRVSEIVGDVALEFDKRMRRQGMVTGAQKSLEATMQTSEIKIAFEQYSKGVNAYIKTLEEKELPVEYKLLGMIPEEWSPLRSMLLLNYMANMLNTQNNDIEYSNFLDAYGFAEWNMLFGGYDDLTEPIVNAPDSWGFDPIIPNDTATDLITAPKDLAEVYKANPYNGSNNWAIAPDKSATGNAILANDPHLSLNLPALWFLNHLKTPKQNVIGASIPGTPGIVIGFNDSIAWGFTNAQRDMVDWYRIEFSDQTKNAILVDGIPVPIEQKIEAIKTKGGKEVFDTLYYSPFGIIANYSELKSAENEAWAYRWLGQDASEVAIALLKLNRGQNMQDYIDASNHFSSPGQNIVFADVKGNIGIRIPGKYLLRQPNEGLFLRDGTKSANTWQNYIPTEQCVQQFNPERGFVSSANQFPVDSTYPYFIAATQFESYRNRRINQILSADTAISINEVKLLHSDNYNLEAAENLKYWLAALKFSDLSQQEQSIFNKLMNWNFFSNPEMEEPAYYNSWRDAILQNAWDEMNVANMTYPTAYRTFKLLKEQPELRWWDISITDDTEDAQALIRYAFAQAISELDMWREEQSENNVALNWGNVKATRLTHLTRQIALSQQDVFIGGNHGIVNATSETHGPSWRQVVELDPDGVRAWGIYPGGQSGNPGSMWYTNYTQQWAAGQYLNLNLSFNQENAQRIFKTSFKPVEK